MADRHSYLGPTRDQEEQLQLQGAAQELYLVIVCKASDTTYGVRLLIY
ncbi:hypothetical protein TcasGA2_TC012211 [Tribolium castaneum]|uniref:Uncharacterized protein n=1 Tax=Tribolium castaneum TaxID=7070 RepID=D6X065_TRICA|nr:hypothetical protein TcasGA2_TC012211 [Tribolium castaneum]